MNMKTISSLRFPLLEVRIEAGWGWRIAIELGRRPATFERWCREKSGSCRSASALFCVAREKDRRERSVSMHEYISRILFFSHSIVLRVEEDFSE